MLKAIVRHYLKFKMEFDEIEHVDKRGIQQRKQVEARGFAFAEAANEVLLGGRKENLEMVQNLDDLNDVRDAQQILQEDLAFIERIYAVTEPELRNVQSDVQYRIWMGKRKRRINGRKTMKIRVRPQLRM